jgi:hypothetical protein
MRRLLEQRELRIRDVDSGCIDIVAGDGKLRNVLVYAVIVVWTLAIPAAEPLAREIDGAGFHVAGFNVELPRDDATIATGGIWFLGNGLAIGFLPVGNAGVGDTITADHGLTLGGANLYRPVNCHFVTTIGDETGLRHEHSPL